MRPLSGSTLPSVARELPRPAALADYVGLLKLRLVSLVLFTTAVGFVVGASGPIGVAQVLLLIHTVAGAALAACGSMALNQFLERLPDGLMRRTASRPLPSGRVSPPEALIIGVTLSVIGVAMLLLLVNPAAAALTAATNVIYVAAYTPLKRITTLNTVVGAVSGALPPLIGWAAARGTVGDGGWTLFAILFTWQIPHFLAIAWLYREEYARAGFRMLPMVDPQGLATSRQIMLFALALLAASVMPSVLGLAGGLYFVTALLTGLAFIATALLLAITLDRTSARRLFLASVVYLPVLLTMLMVDRT